MQTLRGILIKTCSEPMQRIYTRGSPAGAFPHKCNAFSFHYTTDCAALSSFTELQKSITCCLNSSMILWHICNQKFKTLEHLKCLKQSFKIFKPKVLNATSFKRWNETGFQNFCDTYRLSKILFKNMYVFTHRELGAF